MNGLILTTSGAAEIEAAYQNGQTVTVRHVLLGDGGGRALPSTPDEMAAMTSLYGEFGQEPFSDGAVEEGFISGDIVIDCKSYPGKTLRELGMISDRGTLIAYGRYPDTFLPDQTDSVIKEVILTLVLGLTHAQNVVLEVDPDRAIITQEIGDRRYLQRKKNLSDVEDKDEAVENLGLKPTVDKAKNAVQRDGDTMTGELKIRGVNALRIFNEAFGLIFRRSEDYLHFIPTQEDHGENGDIGPLRPISINLRQGDVVIGDRIGIGNENNLGEKSLTLCDSNTGFKWGGRGVINVFAEGHNVFRFTKNGVLALENLSTGNLRKFTLSCDSSSTKSARFNLWGNSSRPVVAELGDDSGWHFYSQRNTDNSITFAVNGQMVPSNYGNFDARYQTRTGGVQDVRLGGAIGIGRGGNAPSGHLLSGVDGGESVDWANARPVQVLINGVWRNVASL
ncbi:TPA: phage tail protein [Escherichia coli]|uniref:phage tail-collar fiber domain-containing protein n=1 Tax=Escherichia coli TaxID=562 RepID=UPI000944B82C|nr:phage tail protein [Escherichia coli]EER1701512.1 phage tail protein [Escherichia coli]EET0751910.1 phage tail protein [Escherichia coli]EET5103672.1 phage tail protein [Escherichia coli]EEU3946710.1 phage tail protein [Escherichia coli]EFL5816389.1 phage tail protein [Escherichia coli]